MVIASTTQHKRVLLVEPDEAHRLVLKTWLCQRGYEVLEAADGRAALDLIDQRLAFDIVVMEQDLPDQSADAICQQLRFEQDIFGPTVLLCGSAEGEDALNRAFAVGAQDFLKKPLVPEEVCARVEHAYNNSNLRRDLAAANLALNSEIDQGQRELQAANRQLKLQLLTQQALYDVSHQLNSSIDIDEQINILLLTVMGQVGVETSVIFTAEGESNLMGLHSAKGVDPGSITAVHLDEEEAFLRFLEANPKPTMLRDLPLGVKTGAQLKRLLDMGLVCGCPIHIGSRLAGTVFLGPKMNGRPMTEHDFKLLASIGISAGIAMEKADLFKKLQQSYVATIQSLMSAMEAKDTYTRGHTARVSRYALSIAEAMGFNKETMEDIRFGATLHDIGKIGIHESILNKPGLLTDNELELMKEHPALGDRILRKISFLGGARKMVRHHHERWDGAGYPDGLKAEEISVGARIVTVADSFDAMTSKRTYSEGMGLEEAIMNLTTKIHTQFCPDTVPIFVQLLRDGLVPRPSWMGD